MFQEEYERYAQVSVERNFYKQVILPAYLTHGGDTKAFSEEFEELLGDLSAERVSRIVYFLTGQGGYYDDTKRN